MKPRDDYRITAVRLVEFHNLGTTTIEISEGGHLFLLGDNGSGKTTLLDAIHLVLTAGREMELNSAARVAGSKDSGRSMQGIVLRYNAATGRTFRESGITYAALELRSDSGKVLSLAIGISAEAMDVAFERWGGIASVPVAELPMTVEEGGRLRTATQADFKRMISSLEGGHYYAHTSDYRDAVAARIFGNASKYADVCHLLRTGKAYREIAARATNYDDLFRQLLEDPEREAFEPLLKGLRELDESEGKFNELDARADYLSKLRAEREKLSRLRLKVKLVTWFEASSRRTRMESELAGISAAIDDGKRETETLERDAAAAADAINALRDRLTALRAKDATGLIEREKLSLARADSTERLASDAERELASARKATASAAKAFKVASSEMSSALAHSADDMLRAAKGCGFSAGTLADLMRAFTLPASEACHDALTHAFSEVHGATADRRDEETRKTALAERNVSDCENTVSEHRAAIDRIRARGECIPEIDGFAEVLSEVGSRMLKAKPAYAMLEPASGCDSRHLALMEKIAGDAFLGTWLVTPADSEMLRKIIFRPDGACTMAVRGEVMADERTTAWLGRYVSYEESDPEAVKLLSAHLAAAGCPTESEFVGRATWMFRGREGLMPSDRPRLIGIKAREAEHARQDREAEKALCAAESELKAAERAAASCRTALKCVTALDDAVKEAEALVGRKTAEVMSLYAELKRREERGAFVAKSAEEKGRAAAAARAELEDIRVRMRTEGIDERLERRINDAERQLAAAERSKGELERRIGSVRGRLDGLVAQREQRERDCADVAERVSKIESAISPSVPAEMQFADFARSACPEGAADGCDYGALKEMLSGDARVCENNVEHRIREPRGEPYAFAFDRSANTLSDRRGVSIDDVFADERRRLEELRGAINQKSREIFERIFVGEVMRRLYIDYARIRDLVGRVQKQLAGRRFGTNRYEFSLQVIPEYEGFVKLVSRVDAIDSMEGKAELRNYIESKKDEILHADVDSIPKIFDYREWFRFVLKVVSENDEGMVIDRKVKSMGSGGEQAVPNYLLILTVAEFLYHGGADVERPRCAPMLFDEAFYGIDAARRDQLLAFADDLGLQLFVSSPDQDGVKREIRNSVSLIVVKDENLDVHLSPVVWHNVAIQSGLFGGLDDAKPGLTVMDETK